MVGVVYEHTALIDTSAVIALSDPNDRFHKDAAVFFKGAQDFLWFTVSTTAHELFTRMRYDRGLNEALGCFDYLRADPFQVLSFDSSDEQKARSLLQKYDDQVLSFHDVICAVVMLRRGIYKIFSFDKDFWVLGFQVVPGRTA